MYSRTELAALKTANQVQTAIDATNGTNTDVATNLGLKRWIVVFLRQWYNKRRI